MVLNIKTAKALGIAVPRTKKRCGARLDRACEPLGGGFPFLAMTTTIHRRLEMSARGKPDAVVNYPTTGCRSSRLLTI